MVDISVCANVDHDSALSGQLASEFPGFWDVFYDRHPKFAAFKSPAGPIGWTPVSEVYEAVGETISAFAPRVRSDFAARVLENVREDIRDEVAYALELATATD